MDKNKSPNVSPNAVDIPERADLPVSSGVLWLKILSPDDLTGYFIIPLFKIQVRCFIYNFDFILT